MGLSGMDVNKMLQELRNEREQIEEAILTLERLARGRGKRRGRPPAWLSEVRKETESVVAAAAPAPAGKPGRKPKAASDSNG